MRRTANYWTNFREGPTGEVRRVSLPRTRAQTAKKGYCPLLSLPALGLVAPLDACSVLPHRFGRLCPVAHPKCLVNDAQMLLDRRLRQVQPLGYLGVAQALHNHLQDLALTGREFTDLGVLVLAQEVSEQLSGGGKLALLDHFHCSEHLGGVHHRVHEPIGAVFQRAGGQPKIQLRTEHQKWHCRIEFTNASHALQPVLLHAAPSVEHHARGAPGGGLPTDFHVSLAFEGLHQTHHRDRVRGGDHPDQPQGLLGRARCLWHRLQAPSWGLSARRRVDLCSLCPQLSATFLCSHHVPSPSFSCAGARGCRKGYQGPPDSLVPCAETRSKIHAKA